MRLDIEYTDEGVCDEREEAAVQLGPTSYM